MGVVWNLLITAFFLEWTEALNSLNKSPLTLFIMCDKTTWNCHGYKMLWFSLAVNFHHLTASKQEASNFLVLDFFWK